MTQSEETKKALAAVNALYGSAETDDEQEVFGQVRDLVEAALSQSPQGDAARKVDAQTDDSVTIPRSFFDEIWTTAQEKRAREALALLEAQTSAGECPHCQGKGGHTESMCGEGCCLGGVECEYCNGTGKAASQQTRGEVHDRRDQVCEEICRIMKEYDRQISVRGYVDTPGGLENMGDVWNLLRSWQYLLTPPVAGKDRGE